VNNVGHDRSAVSGTGAPRIAYCLTDIACALGGEVVGTEVLAPGPGHSTRDRSLSVKPQWAAPDGFLIHSFAGDPWRECRDYVRGRLGLTRQREPHRSRGRRRSIGPAAPIGEDSRAQWLWRARQPIEGTVAERYLREARGYRGPLPPTLGFLPSRRVYPPSMIAAFGLACELEPGRLAIDDANVRGVHVTRLTPDGGDRTAKITIGRGSTGSPIVLAPITDGLGLAVVEGIEDGLSIHAATGLGLWAAASGGRLPALADAIPRCVECVSIFGHDDPAGRRHACELAARLRDRGVEVLLKFLRAESAP
jgi:hypothetical protein